MQEEIRIAVDLAPEAAELLLGTPIEEEKVKLMSPPVFSTISSVALAQLLVDGRLKSVKAAIATLQRSAEHADASKGEPTRQEAPAGTKPYSEVPADELLKMKPLENKNERDIARAKAVLQHLDEATRLLLELHTEERLPGVLADEVDAAAALLPVVRAHVENLAELLAPMGRGRVHPQGPRANVKTPHGRAAA